MLKPALSQARRALHSNSQGLMVTALNRLLREHDGSHLVDLIIFDLEEKLAA